MSKSRNIRELLIILREGKRYYYLGLCSLATRLSVVGIITYKEGELLRQYIAANPTEYYLTERSMYYWMPGDWKPRLEWLNEHINKLNKDVSNNK